MTIRFFDMFAGIGGFRSGLEAVGGFECIGHCEIDKHANAAYCAMYETRGEYYCEDAREIEPKTMPDFDLLCAGFPCQSFSVAGKRLGFSDTRGTLFFEVARIAAEKSCWLFVCIWSRKARRLRANWLPPWKVCMQKPFRQMYGTLLICVPERQNRQKRKRSQSHLSLLIHRRTEVRTNEKSTLWYRD